MKKILGFSLAGLAGVSTFAGGVALSNDINDKKQSEVLNEKDNLINDLKDQLENSLFVKQEIEMIDFSSIGALSVSTYKKLENGNYLFLFSNVSGLWEYDVLTKNFSNKIETDLFYNTINVVGNNYFIYSTKSDVLGMHVYNVDKDKSCCISQTGYYFSQIIQRNDKFLIAAYSSYDCGLYLYDDLNVESSCVYETGKFSFKSFDTGCLIYSSTNGLELYKDSSKEISFLYEISNKPTYVTLEDGFLIYSSGTGFLRFYFEDGKIQLISENDDFSSFSSFEANGKYYLCGSSSSSPGIIEFDSVENSFDEIYDSGYGFLCATYKNGIIFSSSSTGIIRYSFESGEFKVLNADIVCLRTFYAFNDIVYFGTSDSGVYKYDEALDDLVQISTLNNVSYMFKAEDGILYSSLYSTSAGTYYYDLSLSEEKLVCDVGYYLNSCLDVGNGYLLSCNYDSGTPFAGCVFVDKETKEGMHIYGSGRGWTVNKNISCGSFIKTTSLATAVQGVLYYDYETKTVKKIAYEGHSSDITIEEDDGNYNIIYKSSGKTTKVYCFNVETKICSLKYDFSYFV